MKLTVSLDQFSPPSMLDWPVITYARKDAHAPGQQSWVDAHQDHYRHGEVAKLVRIEDDGRTAVYRVPFWLGRRRQASGDWRRLGNELRLCGLVALPRRSS